MATDQELKKLNKNVEDAINILKFYVGSSAQAKAMNEKQRETISKWFDVVEMEEETQKRQRAFTERERDASGRFISKQTKSANTFLNMAKSVGGMFSNMTGSFTKSIGSFAKGISSHFSRFFQAVKSQFLGLFGEESEWFEILGSIKDSIKSVFGSIGRWFLMLFKRTPSWAGKQIKVLKDMYKLQIKQMKSAFLEKKPGKKGLTGVWAILGGILFTIAAGIGAWLHRKLALFKIFKVFGKLGKFFNILEKFPLLGKVLKGLKFGFKWFGWPLTLLLSIIDFIKGFKEQQGPLFDKIKSGLWKALEGFIDLPIKFIGWITEKVAGLFGVELENIGQKMLNTFHIGFDHILDGWAVMFKRLSETFSRDNLKKWQVKIEKIAMKVISGMYNFFVDFWNGIIDFIKLSVSKLPFLPGKDKIVQGLSGLSMSKMETPGAVTSPVATVAKAEGEKRFKINSQTGKIVKAIDDMSKTIKENGKKTGDAISTISMIQGGSNVSTGGGETQQIPDEIDNAAMSWGNLAAAYD